MTLIDRLRAAPGQLLRLADPQLGRGATSLVITAFLVALLIAVPVLGVLGHLFGPPSPVWQHLAATVLGDYVMNSVLLALIVLAGVVIGGTGTAWLVTMCRFPGRPVLELLLVLPLAMPTYVVAYAYGDLLQYAGPIQTALRDSFAWERGDYWFPNVRSLAGAGVLFTVVLYPYVYLLARASFLEQSICALEVSRSLGHGPWSTFFRVAVPLARPAIAAGAALALMETLADYGAVAHLAVPTYTTGIYRAWISMGDPGAAAQLASALLGTIALVLLVERVSRGRRQFHPTTGRMRHLPAFALTGWRAALAILFCALPVLAGFIIPSLVLLDLWIETGRALWSPRFLAALQNSVVLSVAAALLAVLLALVVALARRLNGSGPMRAAAGLAGLGYAIPGSVIAVGMLVPFTLADDVLGRAWSLLTGEAAGLILTGSAAGLVLAYVVRYLAVAQQSVTSGLTRITPHMEDAARALSRGPVDAFVRAGLPVIAPSLLTAGLIVFVDAMKELPATLLLRPFNMETLATQAYAFAADERLAEAGLPALAIVAAGLIPVALLMREIAGARAGRRRGDGDLPAPALSGLTSSPPGP